MIFDAYTTEVKSLVASGSVVLGDDDDDTVTVLGRFVVKNDNADEVISVSPADGAVIVGGSLEVTE